MKRAPKKNSTDLSSALNQLRDQLKERNEHEKLAEQQRQAKVLAEHKEANIFRTNVGVVTPIKKPDIYAHPRFSPPAKMTKSKPDEITSMSQIMQVMDQWSDEFDASQLDDENHGQGLSYAVKGSSPDLLSKLRKGQWPAQAYIDLHGMHRNEARNALAHFLRQSNQAKLRCVCVIHGKGNHSRQPAVLPGKVRSWLCQSELVQAFCPAKSSDGGNGALTVLLWAK